MKRKIVRERLEDPPKRKRERLYPEGRPDLVPASPRFCELMEGIASKHWTARRRAARRVAAHCAFGGS